MNYQKYEDNRYEMISNGKVVAIKDKEYNKYFESDYNDFFSSIQWHDYNSKVNAIWFGVYITVTIILLIINVLCLFVFAKFHVRNRLYFFVISILYTFLHIVLHETFHILALKFFDKKIDKIGFKMNYIFPSVYVRMNDIYMLSQKEKIIVHSAGIFINVLVNSVTIIVSYLFHATLLYTVSQFFVLGIIMNAVPILNSDGYKVLIAAFQYNEKKDKMYNAKLIHIIGYGNIFISIIYFVKLVLDIF